MSDTGRVYQFFTYLLHTIAKENGEGSGEFTFAAVVEKIMPQTGIRGIVSTIEWNVRLTKITRARVQKKYAGIGFQSEYANLSVCGEI